MQGERLRLAVETGALALPAAGTVLAAGPGGAQDLSALPRARVLAVQGMRPDHDALAARGFDVTPQMPGAGIAAAVVFVPRARDAARDLVARAAAAVVSGGPVAVDGQKDAGIEPLLRDLAARVALGPPLVKAHGRLAVFPAGPDLSDWVAEPRPVAGGFVTRPGLFSADGPDAGSALLAAALPARLAGRGVDLGAGWGFLARAALQRDGVAHLDLVEADHAALACARANLPDPRAAFHWADALRWRPAREADWVVMNPPFHTGGRADPALGASFVAAAAGMLAPQGTLWMVANRHLPYAEALQRHFAEIEDIGGTAAFRLVRAARPRPPAAAGRPDRPPAVQRRKVRA